MFDALYFYVIEVNDIAASHDFGVSPRSDDYQFCNIRFFVLLTIFANTRKDQEG